MSDVLFGIHGKALELRSQRMGLITSNIANADTPGYKARDIDFAAALQARVAAGVGESDILPATADLPEFMSEKEFIARFGSVGAPAYRRMMDDIEGRVAALPVLR